MKAFLLAAVVISLANPVWAEQQAAPVQPSQQQDQSTQSAAPADAGNVAPATPEAAPEANDSGRKICRKQEVIGTRLGYKRVCATAAEWARLHAEHQQATELVQNGKFTFDGK
jgi:hypothetical protein